MAGRQAGMPTTTKRQLQEREREREREVGREQAIRKAISTNETGQVAGYKATAFVKLDSSSK